MRILPHSIEKLSEELAKLPSIGPKLASRLTFYLLKSSDQDIENLSSTLKQLKKDLKVCKSCFIFSEEDLCPVCKDKKRDHSTICVVENPLDVVALENTSEYNGVYHILGGAISPIDGIGPDKLRIKELIFRIQNSKRKVKEIILATNPNLEGEATAMFLVKKLRPFKIKTTRIARGLPIGGDLEYADENTLARALEGRKEYQVT